MKSLLCTYLICIISTYSFSQSLDSCATQKIKPYKGKANWQEVVGIKSSLNSLLKQYFKKQGFKKYQINWLGFGDLANEGYLFVLFKEISNNKTYATTFSNSKNFLKTSASIKPEIHDKFHKLVPERHILSFLLESSGKNFKDYFFSSQTLTQTHFEKNYTDSWCLYINTFKLNDFYALKEGKKECSRLIENLNIKEDTINANSPKIDDFINIWNGNLTWNFASPSIEEYKKTTESIKELKNWIDRISKAKSKKRREKIFKEFEQWLENYKELSKINEEELKKALDKISDNPIEYKKKNKN